MTPTDEKLAELVEQLNRRRSRDRGEGHRIPLLCECGRVAEPMSSTCWRCA